VEQSPKNEAERPKKKVRRFSPDRLLRETVSIPSDSELSMEKHRGRMMIRVESPEDGR